MLYMLIPVQKIVIEAAFLTKVLPVWIDLNFPRFFPFAQYSFYIACCSPLEGIVGRRLEPLNVK